MSVLLYAPTGSTPPVRTLATDGAGRGTGDDGDGEGDDGKPPRPPWLVPALLAFVITLVLMAPVSFADPVECTTWSGGGAKSLQAAVRVSSCVMVQPGRWHLKKHVVLPPGHALTGRPGAGARTILQADASASWGCCSGMIDVDARNPLAKGKAAVRHLTLDAAHHALIGIGGGAFDVSDVSVRSAVCNGLSVYGPGVTVDSSTFTGNGYGASCPNAPPGAAIYVHEVRGKPIGPPVITNSTFSRNGTPIDVDRVDGGRLVGNTFSANDGWSAVALYRASGWTVTRNIIRQPSAGKLGDRPGGNFSYQADCQFGPRGGRPAAIWICDNLGPGRHRAERNVISRNDIASYYGVLLLGADEAGKPSATPRRNRVTDNTIGGVVGIVDDAPKQRSGNDWRRNRCAGRSCVPAYV